MKCYVAMGFVLAAGLAQSACQTPQSRQAELARLCADPANRQVGSFSYDECQTRYPLTNEQRQQSYLTSAPAAD